MPTPTYTPIASTTLGSATGSVTFNVSGVQTYRDLIIVCQYLANSGTNFPGIRFNSDTGANYSTVLMRGNGSTAGSGTGGTDRLDFSFFGSTTTEREIATIQIFDYTQSKHKSTLMRSDRAGGGTCAWAGRWANTNAVTSILIYDVNGSTFAPGSTFSLYGVIA